MTPRKGCEIEDRSIETFKEKNETKMEWNIQNVEQFQKIKIHIIVISEGENRRKQRKYLMY